MIAKLGLVLKQVAKERKRQDKLWGEQNHPPHEWVGILGEEFGEVCKEANDNFWYFKAPAKLKNYRIELIQVAAVAVAMVECLDRDKWR